jgi:hypothetical protein
MTRPNKLEHLSLETLSSHVIEFEGKARANPIDAMQESCHRCLINTGVEKMNYI